MIRTPPQGWHTVPLGEVCEVLDKFRKPVTKKDRTTGSFPYYGATGIVDYIDSFLFDEPLVLLGEDGAKWEAGALSAFAIDGKTWVNNHAHVLRPKRAQVLDPWLIFYLNSIDLSDYITGTTVPKLNQAQMKEIPIPLPPLKEQQAIVSVLSTFDSMIKLTDALRKARCKEARFLGKKLLTRKKNWQPPVKLGDVADIVGGGTPKTTVAQYWDGEVAWLTPRDLSGYKDIYISKGERNITDKGLKKSSAKLVPEGTVLLTTRAPIGYVAIAKNEVSTNQGFKSIIVNKEKALNIFIYYWLKGNVEYLKSRGTGSTFGEVSATTLKGIEIPLPPLKEQQAIAAVLSTCDSMIATAKALGECYRQLRDGLMAQLLSGTWRLAGRNAGEQQ